MADNIRYVIQFDDKTYWKGHGAKTTPDMCSAELLRACDVDDDRENYDRVRRVNLARQRSNRGNKKNAHMVKAYRILTVSINVEEECDAWTHVEGKPKRMCKECPCAHKVTTTRWSHEMRQDVDISYWECWGVKHPFPIRDYENSVCSEY